MLTVRYAPKVLAASCALCRTGASLHPLGVTAIPVVMRRTQGSIVLITLPIFLYNFHQARTVTENACASIVLAKIA